MRRIRQSFGYALAGLIHAFLRERNIQLFLGGYVLTLLLGGIIGLLSWEWIALVLAGGFFLAVELLNTAIERLSDVLDGERKLLGRKEFHEGLKWTKDVAAAASLMSFVAVVVVILIVFWPYATMFLGGRL